LPLQLRLYCVIPPPQDCIPLGSDAGDLLPNLAVAFANPVRLRQIRDSGVRFCATFLSEAAVRHYNGKVLLFYSWLQQAQGNASIR